MSNSQDAEHRAMAGNMFNGFAIASILTSTVAALHTEFEEETTNDDDGTDVVPIEAPESDYTSSDSD